MKSNKLRRNKANFYLKKLSGQVTRKVTNLIAHKANLEFTVLMPSEWLYWCAFFNSNDKNIEQIIFSNIDNVVCCKNTVHSGLENFWNALAVMCNNSQQLAYTCSKSFTLPFGQVINSIQLIEEFFCNNFF